MAKRKLSPKLKQMNTWRKKLSAMGVDYPKRASYDVLHALAKKHGVASGRRKSSRRKRSKRKSTRNNPRCSAKTKSGKQCRNSAMSGSKVCSVHAGKAGRGGNSRKRRKSSRKTSRSRSSSRTGGADLFTWDWL